MWKTDNPGSITFWYPMLQNINKKKKKYIYIYIYKEHKNKRDSLVLQEVVNEV